MEMREVCSTDDILPMLPIIHQREELSTPQLYNMFKKHMYYVVQEYVIGLIPIEFHAVRIITQLSTNGLSTFEFSVPFAKDF